MTTQEQVRDAWDKIATGYDQFATQLARSLAEEVLGRAGLRPGERLWTSRPAPAPSAFRRLASARRFWQPTSRRP